MLIGARLLVPPQRVDVHYRERAVTFGRFRASDVRSIIAAGAGVAKPTKPGEALVVALPTVGTRPLSDYAVGTES